MDKVALPYVTQVRAKKNNPCPSRVYTCKPAFSFQNILPLTEHAADFKKEVSKQIISGNLDAPEAGLDAIMQAAVCQVRLSHMTKHISKRTLSPSVFTHFSYILFLSPACTHLLPSFCVSF